jgi:hypothetical protein
MAGVIVRVKAVFGDKASSVAFDVSGLFQLNLRERPPSEGTGEIGEATGEDMADVIEIAET